MMFKSILLLLTSLLVALVALAAPSSAGHIEIAFDSSATPLHPPSARFACVIRSTTCKSPSHYTDLTFHPALTLTTCHHDGALGNIYNRLNPFSRGKGMFVNTFYVGVSGMRKNWSTRGVRWTIEDAVNTETNCNANIDCSKVKDVDEKCFPK